MAVRLVFFGLIRKLLDLVETLLVLEHDCRKLIRIAVFGCIVIISHLEECYNLGENLTKI
jgi:hypothetical protein